MSLLAYLTQGLVEQGRLRASLETQALAVADSWTQAAIDPAKVEILAEYLARLSRELGDSRLDALSLLAATAFLDLPAPVAELLQTAAASPCDARTLAALAVHLADIVEAMAIKIYVPELPALTAKSDRTGEAARSIGVAKHLRG